jgi:hypothetical protein
MSSDEWWKTLDPAPPSEFPLPDMNYNTERIDMVIEKLYITDICGAESVTNADGYTLIISLTGPKAFFNAPDGVEHYRYAVADAHTQNLVDVFSETSALIDEHRKRGGKVLVHCIAGMSRSASVVIAYLITHCRIPFKHAYNLLWERRPCIYPNEGFIRQLKSLT